MILHGKNDAEVPVEYAARLDKVLSEYGKMKHAIVYFGYLGHFFGKLTNDGLYRARYDVDKEALANIRDWLNLNTVIAAKPDTESP